jgi:hypothetical protein
MQGIDTTELDQLLKELKDNRVDLHGMLNDISRFRKTLDTLLPDKVDYRNRFILAERIKTIVQIIQSELSVRKQIDDSIKSEVDLRKKISDTSEGDLDYMPQSEKVKLLAEALDGRK